MPTATIIEHPSQVPIFYILDLHFFAKKAALKGHGKYLLAFFQRRQPCGFQNDGASEGTRI